MEQDSTTIEYITNCNSTKIEIKTEDPINEINIDVNSYEDESEWKNYATEFETEEVEDQFGANEIKEEIENNKNSDPIFESNLKTNSEPNSDPISEFETEEVEDQFGANEIEEEIEDPNSDPNSESNFKTNSEPNSDPISESNFKMNSESSNSDLIFKSDKKSLGMVQCPICDITFTGTSTTVKMHMINVHITFKCDFCEKFDTNFNLSVHVITEHNSKNKELDTKNDDDDEYHHLVKSEKENFEKIIKKGKNLAKNEGKIITYNRPKKYLIKGKKLAKNEGKIITYNRPKKYLIKPKPQKEVITSALCEICNTLFKGKSCESNLKQHIKYVHEKEMESKCDICKKVFRNKYCLRRHDNSCHKNMKAAKCDSCGKSFSEERYMKLYHKCRIHKCDLCDQKYTNAKTLQRHIENCQKTQQKTPSDSILSNSDTEGGSDSKKPYKCDICEIVKKYSEIFTSKTLLKAHMAKNHTETKIYKCDSCGKKFKSLIMIQKHIAKNLCNYDDQEQKFLCYICDKSFKTAEKTKKHISKDHNNEMKKIDLKR